MQVRVVNRASDLTDLIGSRICHDLISPLGAISNGLELLVMTQPKPSQEIDLISESIESANARIRFFRIAYGAASPGQMVGEAEAKSILADVARGNKMRANWNVHGDVDRQEVKLAFLLIQCFETAMPWGGSLDVSREDGAWTISGEAERMQLDPDLWHLLSQPTDIAGLSASKVHFALSPLCAEAIDRRLTIDSHDHGARIRF